MLVVCVAVCATPPPPPPLHPPLETDTGTGLSDAVTGPGNGSAGPINGGAGAGNYSRSFVDLWPVPGEAGQFRFPSFVTTARSVLLFVSGPHGVEIRRSVDSGGSWSKVGMRVDYDIVDMGVRQGGWLLAGCLLVGISQTTVPSVHASNFRGRGGAC